MPTPSLQRVPSTRPPHPFCAIAILSSGLTHSSSSTQQQGEVCGPNFSVRGSSLLQTLGLTSALHNQPLMLQPHWTAGSQEGAGAPGSPVSCARAPADGFSLVLQTRLGAGEPSSEAELWPGPPGTPCAPHARWPPRGPPRPEFRTSCLVAGPGAGSFPAECELLASRGLAALCLQGLAPGKRSATIE